MDGHIQVRRALACEMRAGLGARAIVQANSTTKQFLLAINLGLVSHAIFGATVAGACTCAPS